MQGQLPALSTATVVHSSDHGLLARAQSEGQKLSEWPASDPSAPTTSSYLHRGAAWIVQPGLGAVRISRENQAIQAFVADEGDRRELDEVLRYDWLPVVYQFWGRQVLHASAALDESSKAVIAFTGSSGAGKSTLAYGLGRRRGWRQLADDTLAFARGGEGIELVPIPNRVRLRPASVEHFQGAESAAAALDWPPGAIALEAVYCLDPAPEAAEVEIIELSPSEAYPRLLEQAWALTLDVDGTKGPLVREYLHLARHAAIYLLRYPIRFDALEATLDRLAEHARIAAAGSQT